MKLEMLDIGKIVNTHGVRGELKVQPWCDDAEFICGFDVFFLDGEPIRALTKRVHKDCALLTLDGVDTMEKAEALRGKVLSVRRADADLGEGRWFNGELMGLKAVDAATGNDLGTVEDILSYPASNVLDIRGTHHYLVPAVAAFIKNVDIDGGIITLNILEGMADDED